MPQLDIILFSSEYIWLILFISIIYNLITISLIPNIIIYFLIEKNLNLIETKKLILYTRINLLKNNIINVFLFKIDFFFNLIEFINFILNFYFQYINFFSYKKQMYFQFIKLVFFNLTTLFKSYNYIYLISIYLKNKN